ncbi:MAG: acetoacetate--CoA ligase [Ignavibacterium sp.]|nr:acetoacetate--CoA ligase [Ignavibacterium sp.]
MIEPLWIPSADRINKSNLMQFISYVKTNYNFKGTTYSDLYNWSVNNIEVFWESIWKHSGLIHSQSYKQVLVKKEIYNSQWFTGSKLNFAQNLLRYNDDHTAIISCRENYPSIKISYKQLNELVARTAASLKNLGVKKGDRVAAFISNIPEAVIAMLAVTSLGAIWSSTSPDFGIQGVIDRFGQIKPKVLLAIKSYYYNGKYIDCRDKIRTMVEKISSIEKVILVDEFNDFTNSNPDNTNLPNSIEFNELISNTSEQITYEQSDFDHPVYIMYSSGTTGIPKCIVHGAGGTLLQHFKEHLLHSDLKRDDTVTYFTTCGWMMWNWLVGALQIGASILLYDGSPIHPNKSVLWKLIEKEEISVFGTSPKYLSMIAKLGYTPKDDCDLASLKTILSTGSPLSDENFNWVYSNVKKDILLSSISGGTDIISCFMLGCPIIPVYPGEIQSRGLGMKVEAWDDNGTALQNKKGELVCTAPFPSRPVYFWNDPENIKYKSAYFEHFPGVWRHGDYIKITETGGVIVYGRSDATLNPGGVRIGTAEIYRIVDSIDEVSESLVVGQNWNNDVRIILFVVLKNDIRLNDFLIENIKTKIRISATPRHVPALIYQIKEVPHTISGKKVELAVTRILNGEKVDNKEALANPESLDQFYRIL